MGTGEHVNRVGKIGRLYITRSIWVPQRPLQEANVRIGKWLYQHMPRLPLTGDEALEHFAELRWLQCRHDAIRSELLQLLERKERIPNPHQYHSRDSGISSTEWRTYVLRLWGHEIAINTQRCPETMRVLDRIPRLHTAIFSILDGYSSIPPHTGWASGVIRCHYPLMTPQRIEDCFIDIAGRRLSWKEGEPLLFDDTQGHFVRNDTPDMRVVLIVDFEPPFPRIPSLFCKLRYHVVRRSQEMQQICEKAAVP